MKIVVTGASGFIGKPLCSRLQALGFNVFPVVRSMRQRVIDIPIEQHHFLTQCDKTTDWSAVLKDTDIVINLLARAHKTSNDKESNLSAFRATNVEAMETLVQQAIVSNVKQIIHLSSIKVNGEKTSGKPFHITDPAKPEDAYGCSKHEAENVLKKITESTATTVTIIRPPLVYGHEQKGNLEQLQKIVALKVPLPFANIQNKRHMISLYNLIDLIAVCINNPKAANQTFLASDQKPISTTELIQLMGFNQKPRLFYLPTSWISLFLLLIGRRSIATKLFLDLEVDATHTYDTLSWQPPFSVQEGFDLLAKQGRCENGNLL